MIRSDTNSSSNSDNGNGSSNSSEEGKRLIEQADMRQTANKKETLKVIERQLQDLNMHTDEAVMEAAVKPGTVGEPISLSTNAYGIKFAAATTIYNYHVDVHAELSATKIVEFSKSSKDDFLVTDRRRKCMVAFETVMLSKTDFWQNPDVHWYDGQHLLFSTLDFFSFEPSDKNYIEFRLPGTAFNHPDLSTVPYIVFGIKREVDYAIRIDKESVTHASKQLNLAVRNRLPLQFIEIAANEYVYRTPLDFYSFEKGKVYLCNPPEFGFTEQDCPLVGDGVRLYVGSAKGVQFIEGPKGRGNYNAALIIDSKKAGFHEEQVMMFKVSAIVGHEDFAHRLLYREELDRVNPVIRGLTVETVYRGKSDKHYVLCVAEKCAEDSTFKDAQGQTTTVLNYFKTKYNISLRFPKMPLLTVRNKGKSSLIPMELAKVVAGQRVSLSQQTSKQSQMTTKACAVPPLKRIQNTAGVANAMGIFEKENPFVTNAGVEIMNEPLKVRGRQLNSAAIVFRERSMSRERELQLGYPVDGKWKFDKPLLRPCEVQIWGIYLLHRQGERGVNRDLLIAFAKGLIKEAGNKGVHLPEPADCQMRAVTRQDCAEVVREYIQNAAQANCQFLFFITGDDIPAHPHIKYYERQCLLRTQDMKLSNAIKVVQQNKWQTLENVFLKTNVKNGGLNYELRAPRGYAHGAIDKWLPAHRIVLGIGFSHSPFIKNYNGEPLNDVPSVIGYACNMTGNCVEFVGGFNFQSKGREECVVIGNILDDVLRVYKLQHGGMLPTELLIYRSGTSEGSYETILSHELPLIRGSLRRIAGGVGGQKVAYICISKTHNVRLFQEKINANDRPPKQNIQPGVVVDQQLTHPAYKQFFLNSHTTLQGSASTPSYTVLVDDMKMAMDNLIGLTYTLTFGHQIVGLTTSLPTPVYVANRYAERGRMLLIQQLERDNVEKASKAHEVAVCRPQAVNAPGERSSSGENGQEERQRIGVLMGEESERNSPSPPRPLGEVLDKMMAMRPVAELTNLLNYAGTSLEYYRVNA